MDDAGRAADARAARRTRPGRWPPPLTVAEDYWKAILGQQQCVICRRFVSSGVPPSLHHVAEGSGERSVFGMVPLCEPHHQGPNGLHGMGPKAFILTYRPPGDSEYGLVIWAIEDVATFLRRRVPQLGRQVIG